MRRICARTRRSGQGYLAARSDEFRGRCAGRGGKVIVYGDVKGAISAECDALFGAMKRECRLSRANSESAGKLADRAARFVVDDDTVRIVGRLEGDRALGRLCGMRPGDAHAHHPLNQEQQQR